MKRLSNALLILLIFAISADADVNLPGSTTVICATVEQGKEVLCQRDDFVERMSAFDRAARMKTDKEVSEEEYLKFVGQNILNWQPEETEKVEAAFKMIAPVLAELNLNLPKTIYVIKTSGKEEGQAPYTRGNAIIFPQAKLNSTNHLIATIAHELFHIFSRNNPQITDSFYAIIGFKRCNEIEFPPMLAARKLTNPDAPKNNYFIELSSGDKKICAVPILFSRTLKYDMQAGGEFFNYLEFKLLIVEKDPNSGKFAPVYNGPAPAFAELSQVSGFIEQVGKNTDYIIHPEEILADNFMLLIMGKPDLPSPEIIEKLKIALLKKRETE
ncbi:MAG: hypothetical protein PHQ00_00815 [Phycisphaerae bacterium]|nr:hypothetical protein [Phycisphaerae bacterium]